MRVITEPLAKVRTLVHDYLNEQFPVGFVFDPIDVTLKIDHDGDEYLNIFIVYEGDPDLLDVRRTIPMVRIIRPDLLEMDFPNIPITLFVEKSEWQEAIAIADAAECDRQEGFSYIRM